MKHEYKAGDKVRVRYSLARDLYYTGTVLWQETYLGMDWVTVKPDDPSMIFTFGSSRDMGNGFKSYIANHPVLNEVFPI